MKNLKGKKYAVKNYLGYFTLCQAKSVNLGPRKLYRGAPSWTQTYGED